MDEKYNQFYERLDVSLKSKDSSLFDIGDTANELLNEMIVDETVSKEGEKTPLRTVLTALLDDLAGSSHNNEDISGMFTHYFGSIGGARDRIATYIRVCRFFDPDRRAELPTFLKFSHYSAIYTGDRENWPNADEEKTMGWLNWALEHRASPQEIYAEKMGRERQSLVERARARIVRACEKFIFYYEGGDKEFFDLVRQLVEKFGKVVELGYEKEKSSSPRSDSTDTAAHSEDRSGDNPGKPG